LKAIYGDKKDTASIQKLFLLGNKTSGGISEDFYVLDSQNHFVCVEVNILMKWQFSVKDET